MSGPAQLALRFPRDPRYRAAELLPNAAQDEAQAWLARTAQWPWRRLVLWGAPGSGKSHLLHAWAERQGGLALDALAQGWPEAPLALDGIDRKLDEPALLHLLNRAAEAGQPVLMSSNRPPGRMRLRLADLRSRLRATTAVQIGPAPDDFLRMLLAHLLSERQLRVAEPLQAWLLARLPRSPGAVRDAVAQLDAKALETGRAISRPLAAAALGFDDNPLQAPARASPRPRTVE